LTLGTTPSQTVGPYYSIGLPWDTGPHAVDPGHPDAIEIGGEIRDGDGELVPDAVIETWQSDPPAGDDFRGFGRSGFEAGDGNWSVTTLKPGPEPGPDGTTQAPHIDVTVMARGMLHRTVTRIYFGDEAEANAADPVLATVPEARRATLIAAPVEGGYRFDVRLQGDGETVFFDV
jgi:protocatechuate 3,4-dioxygenase alpha subunit